MLLPFDRRVSVTETGTKNPFEAVQLSTCSWPIRCTCFQSPAELSLFSMEGVKVKYHRTYYAAGSCDMNHPTALAVAKDNIFVPDGYPTDALC